MSSPSSDHEHVKSAWIVTNSFEFTGYLIDSGISMTAPVIFSSVFQAAETFTIGFIIGEIGAEGPSNDLTSTSIN